MSDLEADLAASNSSPDLLRGSSPDVAGLAARVTGLKTSLATVNSDVAVVKAALSALRQGRKLMSCSHCQELRQQASWLLIGYTRGNNQSEARTAS